MQTLEFDSTKPFNDLAKRALRAAVVEVFGHVKVQMEYAKGAALHFGVTAPSVRDITLSDNEARIHRELVAAIRACLPRIPCTPWLGSVPDELVLYLDIETHEAEKRWDMPRNDFFRLGQYAWGPTGDVHLTDDIFHLMQQIERARGIIAHNGHAFDFSVLLGDAALADERLFDTMVFANQAFAAPHMFTKRDGSTVITDKTPMNVAAWLGLDNLAFQLELEGKEGDLKALAKEFGGFGLIPTDDPRFRAYAEQDIRTLQLLTTELVTIHAPTSYDWDEQRKAAINAQMARNGVRIDVAGAHERIAELTERKEALLTDLHTNYGFPTTGKMPWRTKAGKRAILNILASFDITPENTDPEVWPMLKTGPSLGGKVLLDITEGTKAEDVGLVLAELQGQRWLAQTALDNIYADGLCHPSFTAWQRSGRVSVRNPGLTIWGERNPRDKAYIVAKPGNVLLEADYSNCDQRVVAALSGDPEYAKRFLPGVDGHEITGRLVYGDTVYDTDPRSYRQTSKQLSHGWSYGCGPTKLSKTAKTDYDTALRFVKTMQRAYPVLTAWQNRVREDAKKGFIVNYFGRRVHIDRGMEYTQAPAMHGQSMTTEILYRGLIRLFAAHPDMARYLICVVHDAVLFDLPPERVESAKLDIRKSMETTLNGIHFPVSFGNPAINWQDARHV